jgi:hypothetical protein
VIAFRHSPRLTRVAASARRFGTAFGTVVATALWIAFCGASLASASAVTECGNYVQTGAHSGYWTAATVYGYTPVFNLTTRRVRCSDARRFSLRETSTMSRRRNGFNCAIRWFNGEDWDIRCVRAAQVIHWQGGA